MKTDAKKKKMNKKSPTDTTETDEATEVSALRRQVADLQQRVHSLMAAQQAAVRAAEERGDADLPDFDLTEEEVATAARAAWRDPMTGETHNQIDLAKGINSELPIANGAAIAAAMETIGVVTKGGHLAVRPYARWTKQQRCDVVKYFRGRLHLNRDTHVWAFDAYFWVVDDPECVHHFE